MDIYVLKAFCIAAAFVFCGCIAVMYLAPCAVIALRRVFERAVDSPMRAVCFAIAVGIAVAYGGSKPPPTGYRIVFDPNTNGVPLSTQEQFVAVGKVAKLNLCSFSPPRGKRFAGWRGDNGRRYDDGMLVFNLADSGKIVTLTAIWE